MSKQRKSLSRRNERGFSLIEILIVIALIGLILAVVVNRVFGNKERAEVKVAQTQLQGLMQKVDNYHLDVGEYPENLEALVTAPSDASGWLGPYARADELKDPWKNPIQYRHPGDDEKPYQLTSYGTDGKAGGEGVKADIVVSP